ncbi:MAG: serine hydrolase, partial [Bacteroidota bacterium]
MKKIRIILILFSIICINIKSPAQSVSPALDSILDYTIDSLRTLLNIKSLSAAVQLPDSSVWAGASGISSVNPPANVTINDAYLIGSVSKTMTAACILQLADQNILNLDDSLYQWLDTIQYINPAITIRQLLRHESGIYDVLVNPACQPAMLNDPDSIWDPHDIITTFIQPPAFQVGNGWAYSNTNYLLLSLIIKEATRIPFYDEIRSRFLIPLNLNTITAWPFEPLASPLAHLWLDLNGDGITDDAHNFFITNPGLNASGGAAGCYLATPTDITKWMRSYMRGDLISPALMSQAYVTVFSPGLPNTSYGLGLMIRYMLNYQAIGHGGDFGYAASSWYFPARDISISVFTNDSHHNSWSLIPAVTALLKSYNIWLATTGVTSDIYNGTSASLYPIPFTNTINITLNNANSDDNSEITVSDISGNKILSHILTKTEINNSFVRLTELDYLPHGMYFISVSANGKMKQVLK